MNRGAPPSTYEVLAVELSRTMRTDDVGFTGLVTGGVTAMFGTMIPMSAMELARKTHAPALTSLLAGWCHNPVLADLTEVPGSEFDPSLLGLRCEARDMVFPSQYSMKRGDVTVGFSSGAQVDAEGNLNTVAIGPVARPTVRLVGPILVPEHMAYFGREIVMMPRHDKRTFVERVDHVTGVGFPGGRDGRAKLALPGGGPEMIVSPLCIFAFDEKGRIFVRATAAGVSHDEIRENTGFDVDGDSGAPALEDAPETAPPTEEELNVLRTEVDPHGLLRQTVAKAPGR